MNKLYKKYLSNDSYFTYIKNFDMDKDDDRYRSYCDYDSHFHNITKQLTQRTNKREYIYTLLFLNYKK